MVWFTTIRDCDFSGYGHVYIPEAKYPVWMESMELRNSAY